MLTLKFTARLQKDCNYVRQRYISTTYPLTPPSTCYVDDFAGATYDSIEGRFRIIKKEATALKAEIDNGDRPEPAARTPRRNKSTLSTPKKEKIIGGRVDKSAGTPSKKRGTAIKGIKEEPASKYDFDKVVSLSWTFSDNYL